MTLLCLLGAESRARGGGAADSSAGASAVDSVAAGSSATDSVAAGSSATGSSSSAVGSSAFCLPLPLVLPFPLVLFGNGLTVDLAPPPRADMDRVMRTGPGAGTLLFRFCGRGTSAAISGDWALGVVGASLAGSLSSEMSSVLSTAAAASSSEIGLFDEARK